MIGDREIRDDGAASEAAIAFGHSTGPLTYVQSSENGIYSVEADKRRFLRLVPSTRRTRAQLEAELEFVSYLGASGMAVSMPVRSAGGQWVETSQGKHELFHCSLFEAAPGSHVIAFSQDWDEQLFNAWGQAIGLLHTLSSAYEAPSRFNRWTWEQEPAFLVATDQAGLDELGEIKSALRGYGGASSGLVHGDFGRANFHVDEERNLTVFDFDDCCLHFFAYDIAVALWPLRRQKPEMKEAYLGWMLDGYAREVTMEGDFIDLLEWLFRLRSVFMYLYHVHKWDAAEVTAERAKWLEGLRSSFGQRVW